MKHAVLLFIAFMIMVSPIILMMVMSWMGFDMGNEAVGGPIMLPFYCIFTLPIAVVIFAAGEVLFIFWK